MASQQDRERAAYLQRWEGHLDHYLGGRCALAGQRVLVIGSGWGTEAFWALRRGAAEVVGVDPGNDDRTALDLAFADHGQQALAARATLVRATTSTMGDMGAFDLAISNNVFEHVRDLSANLSALARHLPARGARIHLFADPLFLSSLGHHLPVGPWDHLRGSQAALRARVGPRQWADYRQGLNGMTVTDLLAAVREAGLLLLDLTIRPDPHLLAFPALRDELPPGLKPMDLCLSGVGCTLAFPHNLDAPPPAA